MATVEPETIMLYRRIAELEAQIQAQAEYIKLLQLRILKKGEVED